MFRTYLILFYVIKLKEENLEGKGSINRLKCISKEKDLHLGLVFTCAQHCSERVFEVREFPALKL